MAARKGKLSNIELSVFCTQLALIIKAGISLEEGLIVMSEDMKSGAGEKILLHLQEQIALGSTLSAALTDSGIYPKYMVNMVEIGEASGRLDEVLESLGEYYQRNEAMAKAIKSSVMHPAVMILMMLAVILVIMIEVLPIFEGLFRQLGGEMSSFAQGIMQLGRAIGKYSVFIIALIVIVVVLMIALRSSKKGRAFLSRLYSGIFKKLSSAISSERFASAMALMLSSGMDVDRSLDMTYQLINSPNTRQRITEMKRLIAEGSTFSQAIAGAGLFSGLYARMITVGFKTGTLDGVMLKVALHYQQETERRLSTLISVIEPAIVVVLSLIVGMILLSVMLPLMSIMSFIG